MHSRRRDRFGIIHDTLSFSFLLFLSSFVRAKKLRLLIDILTVY